MLRHHNPAPVNASRSLHNGRKDVVGVFSNDPAQTLVLLIDFKADGDLIWPHLVEQLQPLRQGGFLSYFNGSITIPRPVTVVASGDAPIHLIMHNQTYRDIFYDAPLDQLIQTPMALEDGESRTESPIYNTQNSYYASVSFKKAIGSLALGGLSQSQLTRLRRQVAVAHQQGLKVRYWGTPSWPAELRDYIWRVLVREQADVINVDDLHAATRQGWKLHT